MMCHFDLLMRHRRATQLGRFAAVLLLAAGGLRAAPATNEPPAVNATVITNLTQFWALKPAEQNQVHRIRMKLLVYYCDPVWNVFWGRSGNLDTFLPLKGLPVSLKSGDRILVDGWTLPVNQELLWDRTKVKVLSESNSLPNVSAVGKLFDVAGLDRRFVEVQALVDSQVMVSANVLRLDLLVENFNVTAFVLVGGGNDRPPELAGKFVRLRGVYSDTLDPFGKIANITLWVPGPGCIQAIGSDEGDRRFAKFSLPLTASENLPTADPGALVHVRGVVRSQQPGQAVTIWDDTGQIRILTRQQHPLEVGDQIEAVGYPVRQGIDWVLQDGLFRLTAKKTGNHEALPEGHAQLHLAEQVRGLDQEELGRHPSVRLEGLVTWVDPRGHFIFVLDSSGGIQVMQPQLPDERPIQPGMTVKVTGAAAVGEFAPVLTNAMVRQTGVMTLPDAPLISLEEALTGAQDGRWIQMRGYVRKVIQETNSVRLQLVASVGEFVARFPRDDSLNGLAGSVVLVRGVCVCTANARRQLTGIEIWSPQISDVQVEQYAPADLFALPLRPLASLRQFNLFNSPNERVRTSGAVTLQVPGRYLYVQDGDNSVLALSEQADLLHPGDRVEVVGFPGNENGNFLLREAVYHRLAAGPEPVPAQLPVRQSLNENLDGLLVRAEGQLLDVAEKPGETRLIIQAQGLVFEAQLDQSASGAGQKPELGSRLAVTGVYRIQRDEYGRPHSFLLNLRNWNDVRVLQPPSWWTFRRLLLGLAAALVVSLLALAWAWETRRKNRLLQHARTELEAARDKLEERVRERTRELREQVEARERANARLSEAQQRLIVASRQAGMAEVATGILHNVGNVLNSVNVSASMVTDSLQRLRIDNFSKAVALLKEQNGNFARFLTEDPRGRALPGYLQDLAGVMVENQRNLQNEVKSLVKQIDHVKAVVALQQNYARSSSFNESLDPVEMMEDAVQINQAAYERHGIQVIREYQPTPPVFADRHRVLQILINLLSNAKYALDTVPAEARQVTLRIHLTGAGRVRFEVSDAGAGILPENLERIFTLGFTTRPNGHGFGLHSGANAAAEMNGKLFAVSAGAGRGASFILELPSAAPVSPETPANADTHPNLL